MKTRRYTPGWSVGILVAMSLGILTWYGVGWWLEPKPLWIRSNDYLERNFIPYGYEQDRKLLVGIEYGIEQDELHNITDATLVVLDARTGKMLASLLTRDLPTLSTAAYFSNFKPQIVGDRVYRLAVKSDKQLDVVELRSWAYATEQAERVLHTWQIERKYWRFEWNPYHPSRFYVQQQLPSLPMYLNLINPANGLGEIGPFACMGLCHFNFAMVESWKIDSKQDTLHRLGQYPVPPLISMKWHVPGNPDALLHTNNLFDGAGNQVILTDTVSGRSQGLPFLDPKHLFDVRSVNSHVTMLHRNETKITTGTNGLPVIDKKYYPSPTSEVNWTFDEWRPLYDIQKRKALKWPSTFRPSMLGNDFLVEDYADRQQLLYYSQMLEDGALSQEYHFHLMSQEANELKLCSSWRNEKFAEAHVFLFNQHLLASLMETVFPPSLYAWMPDIPWVQSAIYWMVPPIRRSVALIDETNGKVMWRRVNRECLNNPELIKMMGDNFLLLMDTNRENPTPIVQIKEYECWALPMVIHSPWWGRSSGLLVMVLLLFWLSRWRKYCRSASSLLPTQPLL